MLIKNSGATDQAQNSQGVVSLLCPGCRQNGSFQSLASVQDIVHQERLPNSPGAHPQIEMWHLMQRYCPNPKCRAHVFLVTKADGTILASYPAIRLEFDSASIPPNISKSFEEALTCHANNCHTAAAIMVRKTLEELCEDRGATGKNLKDKISALSSTVILPRELLDAIDHIRLLGNDAAHLELKHFNNVGKQELEAAIKVTKEVLKSIYQYADLITELKALQKNP
jgi:hypothetical protein